MSPQVHRFKPNPAAKPNPPSSFCFFNILKSSSSIEASKILLLFLHLFLLLFLPNIHFSLVSLRSEKMFSVFYHNWWTNCLASPFRVVLESPVFRRRGYLLSGFLLVLISLHDISSIRKHIRH